MTRMVQKTESVLSGRFTIVEIEHTPKAFTTLNWSSVELTVASVPAIDSLLPDDYVRCNDVTEIGEGALDSVVAPGDVLPCHA